MFPYGIFFSVSCGLAYVADPTSAEGFWQNEIPLKNGVESTDCPTLKVSRP